MSGPERQADKGKDKTVNPSRRDWLFAAGMAVNVAAGLLLAVPLVGFVFSSFIESKDPRSWISLGRSKAFRKKQHASRRIATRSRGRGMGRRPIFLAGFGIFRVISSRCLRSTVPTWVARCAGFQNRGCSCALVTEACITKTGHVPRVRRLADFFSTTTRLRMAICG